MHACLCVNACYCQRVLRDHGAQTASTHATVTMEPSVALRMESVTAALDGQDSTVHSVGRTHAVMSHYVKTLNDIMHSLATYPNHQN